MSRLDANPQNQERLAKIEHEADLISNYSGWEVCGHPEKEHMAYGLIAEDIPWLVELVQLLHEENERQLDRIRELGYKREVAVRTLEWALGEIGASGLELADDRNGEWALRVLATLKGRPA